MLPQVQSCQRQLWHCPREEGCVGCGDSAEMFQQESFWLSKRKLARRRAHFSVDYNCSRCTIHTSVVRVNKPSIVDFAMRNTNASRLLVWADEWFERNASFATLGMAVALVAFCKKLFVKVT